MEETASHRSRSEKRLTVEKTALPYGKDKLEIESIEKQISSLQLDPGNLKMQKNRASFSEKLRIEKRLWWLMP